MDFLKKLSRNPWFWGVVAMIAMDSLFRFTNFTKAIPDVPEAVAHIDRFELIDQNGEPFTQADLAGKVHIVGFFFTSCPSACPALMGRMKELEEKMTVQEPYEKYGTDLKLMAISVDPETDTPEVLRETMTKYQLDPARWTLLTGDKEAVHTLVQGGFKTAMGDRTEVSPDVYDIAHTGKLAMLDEAGAVRGYYSTDDDGLDEAFWLGVRTLRQHRIDKARAEGAGCN
ncbi:MAG: SCO family protein [Proteobacteria bacterium]|nr:SCO family protein [Pseudomonadota bacterium]